MNRSDIPTYHYTISEYDGTSVLGRKGMSGDPIKFYEIPEAFTPTPTAPPASGPDDSNTSTD